ncbi:MAG: hypothetical protein HY318_15750 [Armatimonadetes bacterium]|nr:hypothetical protein [Armatimonadota bacterium]
METQANPVCPSCGSEETEPDEVRRRQESRKALMLGGVGIAILLLDLLVLRRGVWWYAFFFLPWWGLGRTPGPWRVCRRCGWKGAVYQQNLRQYRSKAQLFGVPLVCVGEARDSETGRVQHARGLIAIGAMPRGVIAIGGLPIGVVALGGLPVGLIAFGGLAAGLLFAFGGIALGGIAYGGGAIGLIAVGGGALGYAAIGGGAAGHYAMGGGTAGAHTVNYLAQDPVAVAFFQRLFDAVPPWALPDWMTPPPMMRLIGR